MPAILRPEDRATWLGEKDASPADVKAVLRTFEDDGCWTMTEQAPTRKAKSKKYEGQPGLF
ncbi:MAG: SOS response-associated peptidase [Hyphomicrobium sp.]|nr:SOS response-associated peptidase [Hyphomicrobium sp.]